MAHPKLDPFSDRSGENCGPTSEQRPVTFVGVVEENSPTGRQIVLKFSPAIPHYLVYYRKEKNMTTIRWDAVGIAPLVKNYKFEQSALPYKKVVVAMSKKKSKGVMQLWHRTTNNYILSPRGENELVLTVSQKEMPAQSALPRPPSLAPALGGFTLPFQDVSKPPAEQASKQREIAAAKPAAPVVSRSSAPPESAKVSKPDPPAPSLAMPVVKPTIPTRLPRGQKGVSLNVKVAPIDKVLRTLAAASNKSLVFGDEITGSLTVNLKDLPYEKAVDTILKPTKYRAEHTEDATIIRSAKEGKSFREFQMQYVDANAVKTNVVDIAKDAQVTVDPFTNSIFVVDTVESLNQIERMLASMDQVPKQVEVEAAVVEISKNRTDQEGFDASGLIKSGIKSDIQDDISTKKISPFDQNSASLKGFFVGLSWNSVRGILGLLQQTSDITLLARPRIVALSDQEAAIVIGSKLGYKVRTHLSTGQTQEEVKFLIVGTQLRIKPHITANGDILMYIRPEISDGEVDPTTQIPSEKTTNSETKIIVKDGQTIIMGGLLRDRTEKTIDKVPILGDIPLLGFFFRGTTERTIKNEIMILLSPTVLDNKVIGGHQIENARMMDRLYKGRIDSIPAPKRLATE